MGSRCVDHDLATAVNEVLELEGYMLGGGGLWITLLHLPVSSLSSLSSPLFAFVFPLSYRPGCPLIWISPPFYTAIVHLPCSHSPGFARRRDLSVQCGLQWLFPAFSSP